MANVIICPNCAQTNHRVLRVDPTETISRCWDCGTEFVWGSPESRGMYFEIYPWYERFLDWVHRLIYGGKK